MADGLSTARARRSSRPVRLCRAAELRVEVREPFGGADVDPAAGVVLTGHVAARGGRAEQRGERGARAGRNAVEQLRSIDADAAEREHSRALVHDAFPGEREIAARMMWRVVDENEMGLRVLAQGAAQACERIVGVQIGVDDEERRAPEERERVCDATRGLERLALGRIADADAEPRAVAEGGFDHGAEMRMVDNELGVALGNQTVDEPGDERSAADREQRLRRRVGEWAHPLTLARGEKHRFQNEYLASALRPSSRSSSAASGASAR